MTDTPPDRLASHPKSPFYDAALLERGVGVRFKGVEKTNVDEYCVSEGWVRLAVGQGGGPDRRADDDEADGACGGILSGCDGRPGLSRLLRAKPGAC